MNVDKINGYGAIFRLITPIILALSLFILNGLRDDIRQIRAENKVDFDKIDLQLTNHLSHHQTFDKEMCERLSHIEAVIK